MADLPSWHPCAPLHAHDFQVAIQLTFPDDAVDEETVHAVTTAGAQLEELLSSPARQGLTHLNQLATSGREQRNADEQFLAAFAHRYIAERLPHGQAERLTVYVRHGNLRVPRRFPAAEPEPEHSVEFPAFSPVGG